MNLNVGQQAAGFASDLAGNRAVVIGAGYGVGPEVVAALSQAGVRVVADTPDLDSAIHVEDDGDVAGFLDRCEKHLGGIDILVLSSRPVKNKP